MLPDADVTSDAKLSAVSQNRDATIVCRDAEEDDGEESSSVVAMGDLIERLTTHPVVRYARAGAASCMVYAQSAYKESLELAHAPVGISVATIKRGSVTCVQSLLDRVVSYKDMPESAREATWKFQSVCVTETCGIDEFASSSQKQYAVL